MLATESPAVIAHRDNLHDFSVAGRSAVSEATASLVLQAGSGSTSSASTGLLPLECAVQNYAWGREAGCSEVAGLLAAATGQSTDPAKRYAELWMGTHPSAPSLVKGTKQSLLEWVQANPEALGGKVGPRACPSSLCFVSSPFPQRDFASPQVHTSTYPDLLNYFETTLSEAGHISRLIAPAWAPLPGGCFAVSPRSLQCRRHICYARWSEGSTFEFPNPPRSPAFLPR